ncbi:HNH endonuclease signature motif containing protein [Spirulina sp. CCNP1310]|uniref:HNH endonuclease n=1 Tax=Spirulina sp. CCNP1310 TaxID=3110249 RepID=UPI002B1F8DDC|nr:HNH endonuclease signature motif containing protein [Spirulina sp. CCNP1310]MEA5417769.1 HNH endonuclease signature motif containing protein [Spirulina sp. CCNP1310]
MTTDTVLRQLVRERARGLCEYCHSPERISANRFTFDHVLPRSLGGLDELENLALACRRCNERRYNFVGGVDPVTKAVEPLFNPRTQHWADHFAWTSDAVEIVGTSASGRATVSRLDLNDTRYPPEESIQSARALWRQVGIHPPQGDPIQES